MLPACDMPAVRVGKQHTCRVNVSSRCSTVPMAANTLLQCRSFMAALRMAATTGSSSLYSSTADLSLGTSLLGVRPRSILVTALWYLHAKWRMQLAVLDSGQHGVVAQDMKSACHPSDRVNIHVETEAGCPWCATGTPNNGYC